MSTLELTPRADDNPLKIDADGCMRPGEEPGFGETLAQEFVDRHLVERLS